MAVVLTRASGLRHGVAPHVMLSRPVSATSWSSKLMVAAACARATAVSAAGAVTKARPASRAAWLTAKAPAWTRASISTR